MRFRLALLLGMLLVLWQSGASAQGVLIVIGPEPVPLPRPIILPVPEPPPVSYRIDRLSVQAQVTDQIAKVQVSQSFVNTGRRQMEVQFCFPLPYDGAVDSLTLMVDGREFPARLLPADEARGIYESIVRKNRDPALLEWIGTGMFRTSVFPVPAGAERTVTLSYTQLLRQSERLTDFLFPLSTAKYTSQPVSKLDFRVAIETAGELKSIYSATHAVKVERTDARHAVVSLHETNVVPASDFRLFFDVAPGPVGASVVTWRPTPDDEGYFMLLASPEFKAASADRARKNVVFVLDRSGSMEGRKIEQAREALTYVLNNLREGDRFNIIAYDTGVEMFRPELQTWSSETRAAAVGYVNGLYAGGGTNINDALGAALGMFRDVDGPSYLLFLTDGLPTAGETNEARIVAASRRATPGKVRMINFGVGFDVNSRLLDRLSRAHQGRSEYVRPDEDLEVHVSRLYRKISAPAMTDVSVDIAFDEAASPEASRAVSRIYPRSVPDLFEGEQLILVGRYRPTGRAKITIRGVVNGQPQVFDFPAEFGGSGAGGSFGFVEKLWAMRRIGEIIDELDLNGKNDELIRELVALSTKHGILTPYTSFLADDTAGQLASEERFRRAGAAVDRLEEAGGRGGFSQRELKQQLQVADQAAPQSRFPSASPGLVSGGPAARDLDTDEVLATDGMRSIAGQTLYRRGSLWVTPETERMDLEKDAARIRTIERFSSEYFALVSQNSAAENALLSSQQEGEELLVSLRGQVYRVK